MSDQNPSKPPSSSQPIRIFRGWYVVAGGFLNSMLMIGATIYSFGLFVQPIEQEFGLNREQINLGYMFLLVGFAIWAPIAGKLLAKFDARIISCVGGATFTAGMVGISVSNNPLIMAILILVPIAYGVVSAGAFAANTIVTRWFLNKRGRALGIVAVATSAGGFAISPIFAALLSEFGWRQSVAIMGISVGILTSVIAILLIRDRPSDVGSIPDGQVNENEARFTETGTVMTARQITGSRNFWLIAVGIGLLLGSDQAILTSLVPYGLDRGFSVSEAALLISALTISAIGGKFVMGWLADRVDKRALFLIVVLCNLAFLGILLIEPSYTQIFTAALIVGLAVGGVYPVWTSLTADSFGSASFGIAYGLMNIISMPFALISLALVGRSYDQTGSYDFAFAAFIVLDIISVILVYGVRIKQTSRKATS